MKIGLDFGGVCELQPERWAAVIKRLKDRGHQVYLVSHAHDERDAGKRAAFAEKVGIPNNTFWDTLDEQLVRQRKVEIVRRLGIDVFVEDDAARLKVLADEVGCICVYVPQARSQLGPELVKGLVTA